MAELKDRQQIILLHGAGEFTSAKATELELLKGELVIEHGTEDVKLHTLDNSGNLATIISEKAVDAKIAVVTGAQAEKDAAQDGRLDDIEAILAGFGGEGELATVKGYVDTKDGETLQSAKDYTDEKVKGVTDAQALVDKTQDDRLTAIETAMGDWTAEAQAEKDAAQDEKLDTIAEGAQVNVIETVKLNGVALEVAEDKSVDVTAIEGVADGEQVIILGADNKISTNLSIAYDSDAKEIKLMSGETQIGAPIDATDFIKDGMVSNAELVAGEGDEEGKMFIEITFNSDAESDPIRIDVSSLVDAGAIANLETRVKANEDAIDAIETAMGDWTAAKQALVDQAQDAAIEALQGKEGDTKDSVSIVGAKLYTDEKIQEVRNTFAGVDTRVAANEAILAGYGTEEGETATVKADIDNLQGQIDDIAGDFLKEVEVVDPNNSIVVTPSDNKVTIDFTKLVINGGEY